MTPRRRRRLVVAESPINAQPESADLVAEIRRHLGKHYGNRVNARELGEWLARRLGRARSYTQATASRWENRALPLPAEVVATLTNAREDLMDRPVGRMETATAGGETRQAAMVAAAKRAQSRALAALNTQGLSEHEIKRADAILLQGKRVLRAAVMRPVVNVPEVESMLYPIADGALGQRREGHGDPLSASRLPLTEQLAELVRTAVYLTRSADAAGAARR